MESCFHYKSDIIQLVHIWYCRSSLPYGHDAMEVCEFWAQYQFYLGTKRSDPWIFINCNEDTRSKCFVPNWSWCILRSMLKNFHCTVHINLKPCLCSHFVACKDIHLIHDSCMWGYGQFFKLQHIHHALSVLSETNNHNCLNFNISFIMMLRMQCIFHAQCTYRLSSSQCQSVSHTPMASSMNLCM